MPGGMAEAAESILFRATGPGYPRCVPECQRHDAHAHFRYPVGMNLYAIIGTIGAACYVFAYFATLRGWLPADQRGFPAVNLLAAVLVTVSLYDAWNLPAFILECFWGCLSIYGLVRARGR